MDKKTDPAYMDPERVREIIDLQCEAAKKDIPCMVFIDREHMAEARENMALGARIKNKWLIYLAPRQYYPL